MHLIINQIAYAIVLKFKLIWGIFCERVTDLYTIANRFGLFLYVMGMLYIVKGEKKKRLALQFEVVKPVLGHVNRLV